jgi:hypothetical protein
VTGVQTAAKFQRPRKPARAHALGVVLAALSLLIQSFIVQPHIDGLAYARADALGAQAQAKAAPSQKAPGVCIICQEAALAGAITLSATPALLLIERNFISAAPARPKRVIWRTPSHNWQSRGPPASV